MHILSPKLPLSKFMYLFSSFFITVFRNIKIVIIKIQTVIKQKSGSKYKTPFIRIFRWVKSWSFSYKHNSRWKPAHITLHNDKWALFVEPDFHTVSRMRILTEIDYIRLNFLLLLLTEKLQSFFLFCFLCLFVWFFFFSFLSHTTFIVWNKYFSLSLDFLSHWLHLIFNPQLHIRSIRV